jgi:probable HAF family extracellular repeat protein
MQKISRAILATACATACALPARATEAPQHLGGPAHYRITILSSLGGTNSRANSIDNLGIIGGYSKPAGNLVRHASVWAFGHQRDLGTLGGPNVNSSVAWPVKNNVLLISGISESGAHNPLGESWSCGAFFATSGNICYGFVMSLLGGSMQVLLPLPGGYNSFATGTNDWGVTVGWAENGVHDPTCDPASGQILQFKPVTWRWGSGQPHALPLIDGDSSGAATAIKDRGQVVGISGSCDQAVGRRTATHAVLWESGRVTDLGNLGGDTWNTAGAINENGDVVGFSGTRPDDLDGVYTHAFVKPRHGTMQDLGVLAAGDISSTATSINRWGQVVGYSNDESTFRAFIWQNGTMTSLASLAPEFTGTLVLANDINDFGQIVGRGTDPVTGAIIAFLATPD